MNSRLHFFISLVFSLLITQTSWSLVAYAQEDLDKDPLRATLTLNPYELNAGQGAQLEIKMQLPAGFHAYLDSLKVQVLEPDGFQMTAFKVTPIIEWFDKFSKKNRQGFERDAVLSAHVEAPPRFLKPTDTMKVELTYQACSDQYCLFPTTKTLSTAIRWIGPIDNPGPAIQQGLSNQSPNVSFLSFEKFSEYLGGSIFTGLIFVFIAGLLTSFTPCIFPMIPITLAVLGNHAESRTRLQNFLMSLVYVLGIATTYSVLGLVAASSGSMFGASLGNPYILSVMCAIFLAMALSMYGLFEIQVPAFIRNRFGAGKNKGGFGGAYVTGLFAGVVASPCVGPVLVAILTYVATTQSHVLGFFYLFTYALGLGMIFLALGLSNQLMRFLPRSGMWMNSFKFVLGTLMLSAFYYYLSLLLNDRWYDLAFGLGLVVIASIYGAFLKVAQNNSVQSLRKGLMQATLMIGIGYLALGVFDLRPYLRQQMITGASVNDITSMKWQKYSEELLAKAVADKKPVIIDFWADWCVACHELEEQTFTDARVRALSESFVLLKFDATNTTPVLKELKKKYMIQGLPTVIFLDASGSWQKHLTLTQFEKPDAFRKRMERTLKPGAE